MADDELGFVIRGDLDGARENIILLFSAVERDEYF